MSFASMTEPMFMDCGRLLGGVLGELPRGREGRLNERANAAAMAGNPDVLEDREVLER